MSDRSPSPGPEHSPDASCRECGVALAYNPWEERPVRCEGCFDAHLRSIDHDFLESYGTLGVTSRRTVAETCLRALVLEQPPQRKVLAMAIVEQFLLACGDLIGLTTAIRERRSQPIVRSFLAFELDAASAEGFFWELSEAEDDLLDALGLPSPEACTQRYPALESERRRELSAAVEALVRDLRTTAQRGTSALLLSQLAGQVRSGPALTERTPWDGDLALRADQVASVVLDERRRSLGLRAISVDEDRLGEVVDAIDCMTRASSNLIYAFLTVQDEEARLGLQERSR